MDICNQQHLGMSVESSRFHASQSSINMANDNILSAEGRNTRIVLLDRVRQVTKK